MNDELLAQIGVEVLLDGDGNSIDPRLMTEDYPLAHYDLGKLMIRKIFELNFADKVNVKNRGELEQALAFCKWKALDFLNNHYNELGERTVSLLLADAESSGWHRLYFEYDNVEELLSSMLDDASNANDIAAYRTFRDLLLPIMQRHGIPPGMLLLSTGHARKFRTLRSWAKQVVRMKGDGLLSESQEGQLLSAIVTDAADNNISDREFSAKMDEFVGRKRESPVPINGSLYYTGKDTALIVLRPSNEVEVARIQQKLNGTCDITMSDLSSLFKEMAEMIGKTYKEIE